MNQLFWRVQYFKSAQLYQISHKVWRALRTFDSECNMFSRVRSLVVLENSLDARGLKAAQPDAGTVAV